MLSANYSAASSRHCRRQVRRNERTKLPGSTRHPEVGKVISDGDGERGAMPRAATRPSQACRLSRVGLSCTPIWSAEVAADTVGWPTQNRPPCISEQCARLAVLALRVGDLERISGYWCRPVSRRAVTWCDWLTRLTLGFRSIAGTCSWPSFPGLSPAGRCPMTTAAPTTALVMIQPAFTDAERLALAGYLAGYRGLTREAYALDLRQFTGSVPHRSLPSFSVRRADIETLRPRTGSHGAGPAPPSPGGCAPSPGSTSTPSKRNSLIIPRAAHVRRPRVDYESHAVALDRNELGALLVAAGLGPPSSTR